MKESYREGIANHPGPEPCEGSRKAALEALDRGSCRLGIELRNQVVRGADGVRRHGRQQRAFAIPRAEVVEGRPLTKENTPEPNSCRTPCRESGRSGLERVREAARKDKNHIPIGVSTPDAKIRGKNRVR